MRQALTERGSDPRKPFEVTVDGEVKTDARGHLEVTPRLKSVRNVLFHDGTNLSMERQMADLAETGMTHELVASLLRGRYQGMRKAIRGTV